MKEKETGLKHLQRYINGVIKHRFLVIFGTLSMVFVLGLGAKHLGFGNNYRIYFGEDNPELLAFEAVDNIYTKNDNVFFVIQPKDGDVFSRKTLAAVRELTKESWQIPYSTRVDSITNFQHTWATEDELIVEELVGDSAITDDLIHRAKTVSSQEPTLKNRLISQDGKTKGINVRVQPPGVSLTELPAIAQFSRSLRDRFQKEYPHLDIRITGIAMLSNAFGEVPLVDGAKVMPIMFAVFTVIMIAFLRSISGTIVTLILVSISAITALGAAGYLKVSLNPVCASAPTIILTLAIADSIHILVTLFAGFARGWIKKVR